MTERIPMTAARHAQGGTPRIRAYDRADLEALVAIETASLPSAWSRDELVGLLRRPDTEAWVIELDNRVAGFMVLVDEGPQLHLANLAVAPAHRRQGLGLLALQWIDRLAVERALQRIVLDVRESNLPAQLLYRKAGYRAVAIASDYYPEEDGYRMVRELAT